jgi:hypothetical protein
MADMSVQSKAGWGADAQDVGVKPLPLPLTVQQQQLQLARKQQLVQALMGQQLQDKGGTQMAGRIAVKKSPFEALSQALSAGLLANKQKELDDKGMKIGEDYNALGRQEMQKYLDTANGYQMRGNDSLPTGQSGPVVPQDSEDFVPGKWIDGDPMRAMTEGLMAQNADVRAIMAEKQKQWDLMNRMMREKGMEGLSNQGKVQAANTGTLQGALVKAEPYEQLDPDKILMQNGQVVPKGTLPQFTQTRGANGSIEQVSPQTNSNKNVGMQNSNTNNANFVMESTAAKNTADLQKSAIDEARKQIKESTASLSANRQAQAALANGAMTGVLQPQRLAAASLAQQLNPNLSAKELAATGALSTALSEGTLQQLAHDGALSTDPGMRPNVQSLQMALQAAGGRDLSTNKEVIAAGLKVAAGLHNERIQQANAALEAQAAQVGKVNPEAAGIIRSFKSSAIPVGGQGQGQVPGATQPTTAPAPAPSNNMRYNPRTKQLDPM